MSNVRLALSAVLVTIVHLVSAQVIAQSSDRVPSIVVEKPPRDFATAEEHYRFLLDRAEGGTNHTMATIPVWNGLWIPTGDTVTSLFLEGGTRRRGGTVNEGLLTPAYEAQFKARRQEIEEFGAQRYDRLTNCEYPGIPRWLREPYVKEFVNTPWQSWMFNDFMNESRRVYIGKDHVNIEAKHSSTGDSIGFWDGDKLVVWTKWLNPADYFRGLPLTSNQFEIVEIWQQVITPEGTRQLITQATFYDRVSLVSPQSAVYTHAASPDLEEVGTRIRNWECSTSSNSYKDEEGNTLYHLPGDPQYKDPRGFTEFPDLPGQSLNPIFDSDEQ